jgi:hypothetical protein
MSANSAEIQFVNIIVEYLGYVQQSIVASSNIVEHIEEIINRNLFVNNNYIANITRITECMLQLLNKSVRSIESNISNERKKYINSLVQKWMLYTGAWVRSTEEFLEFLGRFRISADKKECIKVLKTGLSKYQSDVIELINEVKDT